MKKLIAIMLALPLALGLFGCSGGSDSGSGSDANAEVVYSDSLSILTAAWDGLDDSARFAAFGGDYENSVSDAPGVHNLDLVDSLSGTFAVPAGLTTQIDDAATIMHAMNGNTLTAIVFHLIDGTDVDVAIDDIKAEMSNRQWICGSPDKYIVAKVPGNYLVVVFGVHDVAGPFVDSVSANVTGCEIVVDEPIA